MNEHLLRKQSSCTSLSDQDCREWGKTSGMGIITTNTKLQQPLIVTNHLLVIGKGKRWQQRQYSFQRLLLINTWNIYKLLWALLYTEVLLYLFLPHLSHVPNCQPSSSGCLSFLPPSLISQHSSIFPLHLCHTSVIPMSSAPHTSSYTNAALLGPGCSARAPLDHGKRLLNTCCRISSQIQDHQLISINKFCFLTGSSVALDSEDK